MGSSLCTTISSNGPNPADTTITREMTVTYSTISNTVESVTVRLSEKYFLVLAG